jgi:hypothetical protein
LPAERFAQLQGQDVRGRYLLLGTPSMVNCPRPLFPEGPLESKLFFPRESEPRTSYDYPLADTRLDLIPQARVIGGNFIVVSRDQTVFAESYWNEKNLDDGRRFQRQVCRITDRGGPATATPVLFRDSEPTRQIDGPALLVGNPWCRNYHHWLMNCLPRIWFREQFPELASVPLLLPGDLSPFHVESLTALGVAPEQQLLIPDEVWSVKQLYFPANGDFNPVQLDWLRQRQWRHYVITESAPSRLLYISRDDAGERRVANEPEVAAYLRSRGFECLRLSEMTLRDQVQAFAQARLVVGPHGAGLTNVVFGTSGLTLLELHPADAVNQVFWVLASAQQQRYAFIAGPPTNARRHFVVPIDKLKHMLARLL